jgi:hypothetical protein
MVARMHVALVLQFKIKLWENFCWYFQINGLDLFGCLLENIRLCIEEERVQRFFALFLDFIL